jgi:hypothetical protein
METGRSSPNRFAATRLVVMALFLGAITAVLVPLGSAFLFTARDATHGIVEKDGDHLQLWMLQADAISFTRSIWFEKGRIYNKPGVGPPTGSSAAVACWSFATGTRTNKAYVPGVIDLPPEVRAGIGETPWDVWGVAIDRRGWPLRALEGRAAGTMNTKSSEPYVGQVGVLMSRDAVTFRQVGNQNSLADVRIIPSRPLWRGLVGDALIFAAAWFLFLKLARAGFADLAARRRNRRGLCPHCGYDLTGLESGVCPECGKQRPRPAALYSADAPPVDRDPGGSARRDADRAG